MKTTTIKHLYEILIVITIIVVWVYLMFYSTPKNNIPLKITPPSISLSNAIKAEKAFTRCVFTEDYKKALKYCAAAVTYSPNNQEYLEQLILVVKILNSSKMKALPLIKVVPRLYTC